MEEDDEDNLKDSEEKSSESGENEEDDSQEKSSESDEYDSEDEIDNVFDILVLITFSRIKMFTYVYLIFSSGILKTRTKILSLKHRKSNHQK